MPRDDDETTSDSVQAGDSQAKQIKWKKYTCVRYLYIGGLSPRVVESDCGGAENKHERNTTTLRLMV